MPGRGPHGQEAIAEGHAVPGAQLNIGLRAARRADEASAAGHALLQEERARHVVRVRVRVASEHEAEAELVDGGEVAVHGLQHGIDEHRLARLRAAEEVGVRAALPLEELSKDQAGPWTARPRGKRSRPQAPQGAEAHRSLPHGAMFRRGLPRRRRPEKPTSRREPPAESKDGGSDRGEGVPDGYPEEGDHWCRYLYVLEKKKCSTGNVNLRISLCHIFHYVSVRGARASDWSRIAEPGPPRSVPRPPLAARDGSRFRVLATAPPPPRSAVGRDGHDGRYGALRRPATHRKQHPR